MPSDGCSTPSSFAKPKVQGISLFDICLGIPWQRHSSCSTRCTFPRARRFEKPSYKVFTVVVGECTWALLTRWGSLHAGIFRDTAWTVSASDKEYPREFVHLVLGKYCLSFPPLTSHMGRWEVTYMSGLRSVSDLYGAQRYAGGISTGHPNPSGSLLLSQLVEAMSLFV